MGGWSCSKNSNNPVYGNHQSKFIEINKDEALIGQVLKNILALTKFNIYKYIPAIANTTSTFLP